MVEVLTKTGTMTVSASNLRPGDIIIGDRGNLFPVGSRAPRTSQADAESKARAVAESKRLLELKEAERQRQLAERRKLIEQQRQEQLALQKKLRTVKGRKEFVEQKKKIQESAIIQRLLEDNKRFDIRSKKLLEENQKEVARDLKAQGITPVIDSRGIVRGGRINNKSFGLNELEKGVLVSLPQAVKKVKTNKTLRNKILRIVGSLSPSQIDKRRNDLRKQKADLLKKGGVKAAFSPKVKRIDKQLQQLAFAKAFSETTATVGTLALAAPALALAAPTAVKKLPSVVKKIPKGVKTIIANKKNVVPYTKKQAVKLSNKTKTFGKLLLISPSEGVMRIGGEVVLFVASGETIRVTGKLTKPAVNKIRKINPRLLKVKKGVVNVVDLGESFERKGTQITVKRVKKTSLISRAKGQKPGQFKKVRKGLKLKVGGVKEGAEPLSKQAARAGTKAVAVTAQARKLIGLIRRKRVIRKPLPLDEKLLSKNLREQLKKFDKGKLTPRQILNLNKQLRKESLKQVKGGQPKGIDLLERAAFFDPDRLLRSSRLGIQEEGSILDLLRGNARLSLFKGKPQILVTEEMIEKFPKTKAFKPIVNKLKKNKPLNKKELAQLSQFQVTPTGKLKPVGSTTYAGGIEREVTIAPKDAIKRVGKLGTLFIQGRKVPIIEVKVVKGKQGLQLIKKIEKLKEDIKKLNSRKKSLKTKEAKTKLQKQINTRKNKIEKLKRSSKNKEVKSFLKEKRRARRAAKKRVPVGRRIVSRAITRKKIKRTKRKPTTRTTRKRVTIKRPVTRTTPTKRPVRPIARPTPKPPVKRPPKRPPAKPPAKPPKKPPIKKKIKFRAKRRKPKKKKPQAVFNVFGRSAGKFVKINTKPLTRDDALSRGSFAIDNTTAKTFKLVPAGRTKKPGTLRKTERNYFKRSGFKLRETKIRKGRKFKLKNKFIEKRKHGIDTRGEKKGLTLAKFLKQQNLKGGKNNNNGDVRRIKKAKRKVKSAIKSKRGVARNRKRKK